MNPLEAPMFCMLLRKHCENGIIEAIDQPGMERVIRFHIRQRDELGDLSLKTIVVEIMGRHSNIILLDPATGTILDGIHHVTPAISSYRIVMPGVRYTAPPEQHKTLPLGLSADAFEQQLGDTAAGLLEAGGEYGARLWEQAIVQRFSGISRLWRASSHTAPSAAPLTRSLTRPQPYASCGSRSMSSSASWSEGS